MSSLSCLRCSRTFLSRGRTLARVLVVTSVSGRNPQPPPSPQLSLPPLLSSEVDFAVLLPRHAFVDFFSVKFLLCSVCSVAPCFSWPSYLVLIHGIGEISPFSFCRTSRLRSCNTPRVLALSHFCPACAKVLAELHGPSFSIEQASHHDNALVLCSPRSPHCPRVTALFHSLPDAPKLFLLVQKRFSLDRNIEDPSTSEFLSFFAKLMGPPLRFFFFFFCLVFQCCIFSPPCVKPILYRVGSFPCCLTRFLLPCLAHSLIAVAGHGLCVFR